MIAALIALGVSIYGIRDVRDQVRLLIMLERNREYSKVAHTMIWEFVDPTANAVSVEIARGLHDFCILSQALEPTRSVTALRTTAENESLAMAEELVHQGSATWKPGIDVEQAKVMIIQWQNEKNSARLDKIFGKQKRSLL